jgi:uncharacterized protein DUF3467
MSENDPAQGRPTNFQIVIPPELEGGVYANFLAAWHTAHEFTLDFSATQPPQASPEGDEALNIPCRVVARVKIPITLVFDVIRALNEQMTNYESQFGEIRRPGGQGGQG